MSRRPAVILCSAVALVALQGCVDLDFSGLDLGEGYSGGWGPTCDGPVGSISTIWVTSSDYFVELGDSLTLSATLMDGACNTVVLDLMKSWSTTAADSLSIRPLGPAGDHAIFKPQQTGFVDIKLSVNNVVGSTNVYVLPRMQGIVISPASATIHVGDSVLVSAVLRDVAGNAVDYPPISFNFDPSGVTESHWESESAIWVVGRKPGKSPVEARMFKYSAISAITVVAR